MRKKIVAAGGILLMAVCLSSCAMNRKPKPEPIEPYKVYDQKVAELRESVKKGDMSVAQAEIERQKAFHEYLSALSQERVVNESRNY